MAELSELLAQVMSNPQMMAQVASLAQNLGLQGAGNPFQQSIPTPQTPEPQTSIPVSFPSQPQPPQMDPAQLMGLLMQMSNRLGGDDRQLALIQALKPFVRPERAKKLEKAIQVARMSRLAEQALHTLAQNPGQAGDFRV